MSERPNDSTEHAPAPGSPLHLRFAATSDVGRVRKNNQDSGYAGPHLLVVADGVGGAVRGDVASSATVDELKRLDVPPGNDALEALAGAIHRSHDRLREIVAEHPDLDGTSTTVSAGIFDGTRLGIAHVGDSRAYLLRDGTLEPLTTDHTLVQSLIEEGRITEEEARVHPHRNLILRAVDAVHEPEPDAHSVELRAGDRLLFCSDGASGVIDNDMLGTLLGHDDVETAATKLVRAALDAGSTDNVTVIVAEVVAGASTGDDAPSAALMVGAAATQPHLALRADHTGNLDSGELAGLREDLADDPDPEELRYAPRPPRRFLWVRRVVALALVLALIGAGLTYLYKLTQEQYYVSYNDTNVAIYQGIQADLPGLDMHSVFQETDIELTDLPPSYQRQVREGISAGSLASARRTIDELRNLAVCGDNAPTPTTSPTTSPTKNPTRPRATATRTAKPSPRPTATPTPRPTTTPRQPNVDCEEIE